MNIVALVGNLTRDVEIKYTAAGLPIANFGIAINKKTKNQTTQQLEDKPVFVDVTAFGRQAEIVNQYFKKGKKIGIAGELNFEQWQAQDGTKRSKLTVNANKIEFVEPKEAAGAPGAPAAAPGAYGQPQAAPAAYGQPAPAPAPAYGQPAPTPPPPPAYAPPPQPAYAPPAPPPSPAYAPPAAATPPPPAAGAPAATPPPAGQQTQVGTAPNGSPIYIDQDNIPF